MGATFTFLSPDGLRFGQRCAADEWCHVFASWMGGNISFYPTAHVAQVPFVYLAYLLNMSCLNFLSESEPTVAPRWPGYCLRRRAADAWRQKCARHWGTDLCPDGLRMA